MAKAEREKALYWVGPTDADGNPSEGLSGINAADLDSFYINELSDEQYQQVLDSKFYQKTKPKGHNEGLRPENEGLRPEDEPAPAPAAEEGEEG